MDYSQSYTDQQPTEGFSSRKNTETKTKTESERPEDPSRKAFRRQANTHLDALYHFASSLPLSEQDIEQLLCETYRRTSEKFEKNQPTNEIKKQLFVTLIRVYRAIYASPDDLLTGSESEETPPRSKPLERIPLIIMNDLDETFFSNISSEQLDRVLEELPDPCRTCITLSDVEGFSYDEVSDILDCTPETVRDRLHQGRNILKRKLIQDGVSREVLPTS